jgi:hypothetical protein
MRGHDVALVVGGCNAENNNMLWAIEPFNDAVAAMVGGTAAGGAAPRCGVVSGDVMIGMPKPEGIDNCLSRRLC